MHDDVLGIILAGGLSRRMEGPEKSLMDLAGIPLIERTKTQFAGQVTNLLLNANGDPKRFEFLGLPTAPDTIDGFAGPLAGVLTGMKWAQKNTDLEWILTVAADTPFFPSSYSDQMINAKTGNKVVLAASRNRRHPVFGLWHLSLADELEAFLNAGERKVMLFVEKYPNTQVDFSFHGSDPFFNVNTPQDLADAEKLIREGI